MRPINLLPPEAHLRRAARRRVLLLILGVVAYVAILAGLTLWWSGRVEDAQAALDRQQEVNRQLQAEVTALATADELRLEYEQNAQLTSLVLSGDVAWGRLLNDFGRLIPERVWMDSFTGAATVGVVPGLVGQLTISGTGFAFEDVSAWLRSLDEERFPGLTGTWVTNASEAAGVEEGDTVVNFNSTAALTQSAISNRAEERIPEVSE
jgi:Tfp pilus assembly protein PilN